MDAGHAALGVAGPMPTMSFISALPAGDYFAVAFEQTEPRDPRINDPDILQQLRDHALPFSIGPTEKKKLDLRLGPPPVY